MTVQRPLWVLVAFLGFWPCYSYSDPYTYGSTNNVASVGLSWPMSQSVLGVDLAPDSTSPEFSTATQQSKTQTIRCW